MAKFYGIGVGPGDQDLMTIKAVKTLNMLDVLLIPSTKTGKMGVAETIIQPHLKQGIEYILISFPMVSDEKVFEAAGIKAARIIEEQIAAGKNIGFVTLGDASVYSTYGYIVKALAGRVPVETVPGITSFSAAAALANRPLVEKDEILTIIPMNATDEQIDRALKVADACVFMKINKREERVIKHLKNHQLIEKGILARRCGFSDAAIHEDVQESLLTNEDYLTLVLSRKETK